MKEEKDLKKALLKELKMYKAQFNLSVFLKCFAFSMCIGTFMALLFQIIAFIVPVYYATLYSILCIFIGFLSSFIAFFIKRYSLKKTALHLDRMGFDERIITTYENIDRDTPILQLQRQDTISVLNQNRNLISIPFFPSKLQTAGVFFFLIAAFVFSLIPTNTKLQAITEHQLQKEIKEATKEIEDIIDEMKDLPKDDFSVEDNRAFQEMIDSLEASLSDFMQSQNEEDLEKARDRMDYKYDQMMEQLSDMTNQMNNMSNMEENMQAMQNLMQSIASSGSVERREVLAQGDPSGTGEPGKGQNGQGDGDNQNGNGQGDGQNGNGQGDGQNGNEQGDGQDGNGQGDGQDGNGQGDGQDGNEQGDGQDGNGQNGQGSGRGEGSLQNERDYVSVPNAIADSDTLHGTGLNSDNSEFFRMPNGLNWRGTHVPFNSVIGAYEQNAYDGINTGRYPESMSEMIKKYFSSFQ